MRVPPPPAGFDVLLSREPEPTPRREKRQPRASKVPPPPTGFTEHLNAANDRLPAPSQPLSATGQAHDGDTFNLADGRRARLYGVDAFEAGQMGRDVAGAPVPLGDNARTAFLPYLPGATAKPTGGSTYGRPVATLDGPQGDAGLGMVTSGNALPAPAYLRADPARLTEYMAAQRDAIAEERGAYAGTYQEPTAYRRQGDDAPWRGKRPMTEQQTQEYGALVRNPDTTVEQLQAWARANGGDLANAENILSFYRRNPNAALPGFFQQRDVQDAPVQRAGQNVVTRHLGALNEGIADTLGAPVDIVNSGLGALGLPMSDRPFLGSDSIREGMHWLGMGQTDQSYAPRSDLERYSQSFSRGIGQAVVPAGALPAAGGRAALSVVPRVAAPSAGRLAVRDVLAEAARRPGVVVAGELGAGAGSGIGAQVADDYAPGNPWASMAAQFLGGVAGGLGAGVPTARFGNREGLPLPGRTPPTGTQGRDFAYIDEDGALTFNVSDEAGPQPRPLPAPDRAPGVPELPAASAQRQPIDPATFSQAESPELLDRVRRTLMEQSEPEWTNTVRAGQANDRPELLDAYDELSGSVAELQRRGVTPDMIERDIAASLRGRGWTHDQIADVMPERFANMRALPPADPAVGTAADMGAPATGPRDIVDEQGDIDTWAQSQGIADEGVNMPPRRSPAGRVENMDAEGLDDLSISAPVREVDRIDVRKVPPPPGGFTDLIGGPSFGRAARMDERPSAEQLAEMARRVEPGDVTPIPANAVESMEEAQSIGAGMRPELRGGDERATLETRRFPSTRDPSRTLPRKGPLDMVSWLRVHGGLRPQGGELAHYGIDNAPRALDFAQAENRLGKLVDPENGLSYDEAALRAWEAGYFPDHAERPTVAEFLDALQATHSGRNRSFRSEDLPEVDAFEAARRQRYAVEQAAQEGRPLVDDLGQPISQADLDANAPPATAYEDLPRVGGRVGNIDLSKVETRQDIRRLLQTTENRTGGFDAARRGRMSQAETEALASELGMTANDLLQRRKGQALNAEEALAARQLLAKSSDELIRLARRVDGGSDAELAEFRRAWLRHAAIQEQVTGATAEAGRALAQFKMAARANAVKGRVHAAMIEGSGGTDRLKEAAEMILDLQARGVPPGQVNKAAVDALKPKWSDKLVELWYNSILSGPQTHAVNILSNTMTAALQLPEMAAAAAIGGARRAVKLGAEDRIVAREIGARAYGLMSGAREGLRAFGRTLKTGEVPDFVTKVEARSQKAISGKKGEIIRFPTRALAAEDELFKAIARRMEIAGLATRKATFEGLTGDALRARVDSLIANPDDKMTQMALDYARYLTFQRPLGPAGRNVSQFTQNIPITKLFLPFVRTPANIFKHVLERSPAAPILKEVRADWKAGGARRDLAIARASLGTGLGLLVAELAAAGYITGSGPMDDGAKTFMRADGWQPYSIKIGDRYYSYQRLDPLASTLGVAADLATKGAAMTEKQSEESVTLLVASIMKNLSDKTWLSGMSDLVEALEDPERNAKRVTGRLAGSLAVPAIVGQTARTLDPTLRETRDPLDFVKARIPGVSDDLPAKRDVWGREIVNEGGVGPDIVSPIWTQGARNDPLNSEMLAAGVRIGPVPRQVGGRELTRAEHDQYRALSGSIMEANMRALIESPEWKTGTIEERQDMADDVKKAARKEARDALFGGYRKAPAKPPGLEMPDDVAGRIFTGPQAPPPPTGFTVPVSPPQ